MSGRRIAVSSVRQSMSHRIAWARSVLAGKDRLDLVLIMSLILVIGHSPGFLQALVIALGVVGLIHLPIARHGGLWLGIAAARALGQIPPNWYGIDNHQYLLTYWCLAIGIALLLRDDRHVLRVNSRLLIGLAFAFATLWKLISPEFIDGGFFHYTLLVDGRFGAVTASLGGAGDFVAGRNADLIAALTAAGASSDASIALQSGPRVDATAQVLAVGTVALEGAVALVFLAPRRWVDARWRDAVLLPFIWFTYALAPVVGFGWLLVTMGLAQSSDDAHLTRTAYVVTFVAIPVLPLLTGFGLVAVELLVVIGGIAALVVHMLRDVSWLRAAGAVLLCVGAGRFVERFGEMPGATLGGVAVGLVAAVLLAGAARVWRDDDGGGNSAEDDVDAAHDPSG